MDRQSDVQAFRGALLELFTLEHSTGMTPVHIAHGTVWQPLSVRCVRGKANKA